VSARQAGHYVTVPPEKGPTERRPAKKTKKSRSRAGRSPEPRLIPFLEHERTPNLAADGPKQCKPRRALRVNTDAPLVRTGMSARDGRVDTGDVVDRNGVSATGEPTGRRADRGPNRQVGRARRVPAAEVSWALYNQGTLDPPRSPSVKVGEGRQARGEVARRRIGPPYPLRYGARQRPLLSPSMSLVGYNFGEEGEHPRQAPRVSEPTNSTRIHHPEEYEIRRPHERSAGDEEITPPTIRTAS